MKTDQHRLDALCRLGRLLDEALDLADAHDEPLLGAQIAQALHTLDQRVALLHPALPSAELRGGEDGV